MLRFNGMQEVLQGQSAKRHCSLQCNTVIPSFFLNPALAPEGENRRVALRLPALRTTKTCLALQRHHHDCFNQPVSDDIYPASKSPSGLTAGRGTPEGTGVRSYRCRDKNAGSVFEQRKALAPKGRGPWMGRVNTVRTDPKPDDRTEGLPRRGRFCVPGAGIVKGAAASPLNTFAGKEMTYENKIPADGTLHHPHIFT